MTRKEFLQKAGIGSAIAAIPLAPMLAQQLSRQKEFVLPEPEQKDFCYYLCVADCWIKGSRVLPVRPIGAQIQPGDLVYYVSRYKPDHPTNGRLYRMATAEELWHCDKMLVHLRFGKPQADDRIVLNHNSSLSVYTTQNSRALVAQRMRELGYEERFAQAILEN